VTPAEEPHGGVLSEPSDHARSGGQDSAAGPIFSDAPPMALAVDANRNRDQNLAILELKRNNYKPLEAAVLGASQKAGI
jgi:hypothetical protein